MNTSGMLRGYLAKMMDNESYFYHVVSCMDMQLNDWKKEAILLFDWEETAERIPVSFFIDNKLYSFVIEKEKAAKLQRESPYSLDRFLWEALVEQGFILKESNYIHIAFQ